METITESVSGGQLSEEEQGQLSDSDQSDHSG